MRILVVEDELGIREPLKVNLELEDYEVVAVENGRDALQTLEDQHFDLILLDLMLPDMDGLQVSEQIRLQYRELPILMLTARNTPEDRISGLKKGADDYLTKPFHFEELLLRIKKLIARSSRSPENVPDEYHFGKNRINFATFDAHGQSGDFTLTKKEAMLMKLLVERAGEVVSRKQILQSVWGYDVFPSTRTIDNFILSFRKYFEQDPKQPRHFLSVRGVGYKFVA